jgi:hypothetical protein
MAFVFTAELFCGSGIVAADGSVAHSTQFRRREEL